MKETTVNRNNYQSQYQIICSVAQFVTPWTAALQAPLCMELFSQKCWRGSHFLLQGIFLSQESNLYVLHPLHCQADSLLVSHLGSPQSLLVTSKHTFFFLLYYFRYRQILEKAIQLSGAEQLEALKAFVESSKWSKNSMFALYYQKLAQALFQIKLSM